MALSCRKAQPLRGVDHWGRGSPFDSLGLKMTTEFQWDSLDFLEILGSAPRVDGEYGIFFEYVVQRGDLRLMISIWPLDCEVQISVYMPCQVEPLIHLRLIGTPGARVINDKRGRFIEFAAANLFSGRFDHTVPAPYGFRVWADPHIKVEPYAYQT